MIKVIKKIILIACVIFIASSTQKVQAFDVGTYTAGEKGTACSKHTSCSIHKGVNNKYGTHDVHMRYNHTKSSTYDYIDIYRTKRTFCIDHDDNSSDEIENKTLYKLETNDNKVTLYYYNTKTGQLTQIYKDIEISGAAKYGYLMSRADKYSQKQLTATANSTDHLLWYSYVQWVMWSDSPTYTSTFFTNVGNAVGDTVYKNAETQSYKTVKAYFSNFGNTVKSKMNPNNPENDDAEQLKKDSNKYETVFKSDSTIKDKTETISEVNTNIIGPFKIKFNNKTGIVKINDDGSLKTKSLKLMNTSNREISTSNYSIGTYVNGTFTTTNKLKSGENFYIKLNGIRSNVLSKLVIGYSYYSVTSESYIIGSGSGKQNQVYGGYGKAEYKDKTLEINISIADNSITINKKGQYLNSNDINNTYITENTTASFKIYCKEKGQWVSGGNTANKTYYSSYSSGTTYTTNSSGILTISKLEAGYTYYFVEINCVYKYKNSEERIYSIYGRSKWRRSCFMQTKYC